MIEFSLRYAVIGFYKDRDRRVLRIYPLPFVRVTIPV
jgi:hypothetical protein